MTKQLTIDHTGQPIAYAVGQPMGARSSWSMFTLSHHLVVQYAAHKAGCYPTDQYILLGDDIVIYDDRVAKQYQEVISDLGVEISATKSHISIDSYEFAKRWFKAGREYSGVPINGILQCIENPIGLLEIIRQQVSRGLSLRSSVAETTASIIKVFRNGKNSTRLYYSVLNRLRNYAVVTRNLLEFNYDEVREFIANATASNEYHIPMGHVDLRKEFLRVINTLYCYRLTMMNRDLARYYINIESGIKSQFFTEGSTQEDVNNHPALISIENKVLDLSVLQTLEFKGDVTLKETISRLTLFDPDLITSSERTSEVHNKFLSKFANELYVQFRDFPDQDPHKGTWGLSALSLRNMKIGFRKGSKRHDD